MRTRVLVGFLFMVSACVGAPPARWTPQQAAAWYSKQPWLVGANYIPAYAINQLEMWQEDTFDPKRIDTELGWAESIGFNTVRVFLHDLLWAQDAPGFRRRIDTFLTIANRHHIRPLFVLFDSCWDPYPKTGPQRPPRPGVHNSGWVQGPGVVALHTPAQYPRLEAYVKGVVGAFGRDPRVLGWDMWNEPDNLNDSSYPGKADSKILVEAMLPRAFEWARSVHPVQPLTSGVWNGDWSAPGKLSLMEHIQMDQSDVISFHNYEGPEEFRKSVLELQQFGRPVLCTEYMARPRGSTFQAILPIAKEYRVAAFNWGMVNGKTQTNLPWDSWQHPYTSAPPKVWFHDIFYRDGRPYSEQEVDFIRSITGRGAKPRGKAA